MNRPSLLNAEALVETSHLIVPSRLNAAELDFLVSAIGGERSITVIADEEAEVDPLLLEKIQELELDAVAISITDEYLSDVGRNIESRLGENGIALFIPPVVKTHKGGPIDVPHCFLQALCALQLPVCPLAVHRPADNKLRIDDLQQDPSSSLCFGRLLRSNSLSPANIYQEILIAAEQAFSARTFLQGSLPAALLRSLYHHGKENFIHDGVDDAQLTYHRLLAASLALSDYIRKQTTKQRVGIILPPGKGGLIANLAVLFAGKIPVNLNFTSSRKAVQSSIQQADLDIFITADRFIEKLPGFPWPERDELVLLDKLVKKLKPRALKWILKMKLFSADQIIQKRGLDQRYNNDEAVLLFTSGSSGMPKGVPLSHRNLLANICQFSTRIETPPHTTLLGCLPLFHSFGCTVTTFFPLLQGYNLVTYPSPLEAKKLGELIEQHDVTLLTATPTFLRGYLRRVSKEQLAKLEYIVTGAEKLPKNLADAFTKRFDHFPQEGYGLTETSPASHLNVPNIDDPEALTIPTSRPESVGLPLTGVAMRMTDPMTGEEVPLTQAGCLWLKGANVFQGYLNKPETNAEVLQDGWFNTGDIGRIDEDGFLSLEGRLSRFSKIAGEMVPHETVEAEINKVLKLDEQDERKIAIVGIPDAQKGEALLLLTSLPEYDAGAFISDLRKKLIADDVPALWCPKTMVYIPQIPILGSGKLDIGSCRQVANEAIGLS